LSKRLKPIDKKGLDTRVGFEPDKEDNDEK
jgi:hypothetical protein